MNITRCSIISRRRAERARAFSDGCVCGKMTQSLEKREKNIICLMCVGHMMHMKHTKFGKGFSSRGRRARTPFNAWGTNSFHRPRGGPPPSKREVLGVRRSRPSALPSIAYRGFAVAPITLRAPLRDAAVQPTVANASNRCNDATQRCKRISQLQFPADILPTPESPPPRPPSSREGDRPQAVEGVIALR